MLSKTFNAFIKNVLLTVIVVFISINTSKAQGIDSLQKRLDTTTNICDKAVLYTNIAADLIQYNQPKNRLISQQEAAKAADYVLKAIHINSKFDDTLSLRNNLDCLAQAYVIQKKYTQAKWFILQSAGISRDRKDVPYIITSLMELAKVKVAIKDYKLAVKDLQEAITLSRYKNDLPAQIKVEKQLAALYDRTNNRKAAAATMSHYEMLAVNLQKAKLEKYNAMRKLKAKAKKIAAIVEMKTVDTTDEQPLTKLNVENGVWVVSN